jgi:cadmium resistance protein CadD (predicted permease)
MQISLIFIYLLCLSAREIAEIAEIAEIFNQNLKNSFLDFNLVPRFA